MMKKVLSRDYFREVMMAVPQGYGALGLCSGLCAVFAIAALHMADGAGMQGATTIALWGMLGVAILLWGMADALLREKQPVVVWLFAGLLAMLAVGAHLGMLDIKPGRYSKVLAPLFDQMWNYELVTAAAWADDRWSGVYLLICALLSRLETFSLLYAVKLVDMICQCLCACAVLRLAMLRGAKALGGMAAMFACVLAPTMLMNAGCWAQCDATFAMFALWGLYLLLADRPLAGCILWGLALGTKLQSAFLFPLLIVLFMDRRCGLGHLLALAAAFCVSQLAIVLDGQGFAEMFMRYGAQIDEMRWSVGLADNAPGVYSLMTVASVREFSGMGVCLGLASALLVVVAMLRSRRSLNAEMLLLGAALLAAGLPLILPQMNARCLYLAGMIAFAAAGNAKRAFAALLLEIASLCSYMASIFGLVLMPMSVVSLLAIAAAVLLALELIALLRSPAQEAAA